MPRGLHLNDDPLGSEDHLSPSPEPQLRSSPSTVTIQFAKNHPNKRKKFDPTSILTVWVGKGNRLLPSSDCSRRCTHYFRQRNDEEGINWKNVSTKTKGFYWGEFKKYIVYPGFSEQDVYDAWFRKSSNRYKNWMNYMYKRGIKPKRGVDQKNWDRWTRYWKTDEFQKKSNRGKKNRDRNGKGMVNHTGGSQTFEVTLERMRENGLDPDPVEFHWHTHSRTINGEIIFCDEHAKQVNTEYLAKEKEALSQLQLEAQASGSSVPTRLPRSHKATLFKEAAGGEKKGEVYGSGSASSHFYTLERKGSSSSSMAGLSSSVDVVELQQNILRLEKTLMEERKERKAAEVRTYKMMKKMMANNKQQQNDDDNTEDDDNDHGNDDDDDTTDEDV